MVKFYELQQSLPQEERDGALYDDLLAYHKEISELPDEEYYDLIVAWDFHTYLLEAVQYSPIICLFAVPERGKSRTGKGMIHVAYRGIHVESLREAYVVRVARDLRASLFFDVKNIWQKAEKYGSEDILLHRFEKEAKVPRVLFPDRGPHRDLVYYSIFGPTVISTNEGVHHILETRAVHINMPETSKRFENDVTPELALSFKERLIAFRARHLCRLYVPARAMHGAVTAELARVNSGEKSCFPDYGKFGHEVGLNCRFTYLFPADNQGDIVWMPKFKRRGLQWYCNGCEESLSDRDFRRRLLDSRPGTAIAPEWDSASEGTLREMECINPWWRDSNCKEKSSAVLFLGYVFLKNNGFRRQLNNIDTLFVGGDTRYGLGKMCRIMWEEISSDLLVFGKRVHLDEEHPQIQSNIVFGHALEGDQPQIQGMQGMKELLGGWDQGSLWRGTLTWAPGSFLERSAVWSIDQYGYWIYQGKNRAE